MSWFYLALLAPLLYAIVNLFDDNLLSFVYLSPYVACISAGLYGALPLLTRFFLPAHGLPLVLGTCAFLAGVLTLCSMFFYFKSLQTEQPSVVVALFALAPATLPLFAHVVVGERLALPQIVGLTVVLAASLGLSVSNLRQWQVSRALGLVLGAALLVDASSLLTKYAYQHADFYAAYLYFSAGMGMGGVVFLLLKWRDNVQAIRRIGKRIGRLLPVFIVAEGCGLAADFVLNLAISRGPVSLVRVIESSQPMFVLLIALALHPFAPKYFREARAGQLMRKLSLIGLIIAGLIVINVATVT